MIRLIQLLQAKWRLKKLKKSHQELLKNVDKTICGKEFLDLQEAYIAYYEDVIKFLKQGKRL